MQGKGRRKAEAAAPLWPCTRWVLLAITMLCLWQVGQLTIQLETGAPGVAQVSGLSAAPPPEPGRLAATVAPEAPSVEGGLAPDEGLPAFTAQGPFDDFVKGGAIRAKELPLEMQAATADDDDDDDDREAPASDAATACNDVHPNADSPDMLHIVFASDASQVEGVQASVASIVATVATPEELTVHILVQNVWLRDFKQRFGMREECQGLVTMTGVLVRVHAVDSQLIERAVAKVSPSVRKERGAIDSIENFARFYMHLVLDKSIVIYLDADTIVQADLSQLRNSLKASGKTVGFVARETKVTMDKFLRVQKDCPVDWDVKRLSSRQAYNVGVVAVNLERWRTLRVAERVEGFVAQHNRCGGKLWVGGSQPPLLLAFLSRPPGTPDDYIVYEAAWNTGDLGWRTNIGAEKLRKSYVLHWNGKRKPWMPDGLHRDFWTPHRARFDALLRPYDGGESAVAAPASATRPASAAQPAPATRARQARTTTTTAMGPEELAARAACPYVELFTERSQATASPCIIGKTFGCDADGRSMWAAGGCMGIFGVAGRVTSCAATGPRVVCKPGALPAPATSCGGMIMTTYFTTKKDWQRGKFAAASFSKIQKLYQSVISHGMNATVLYDNLPDDFVERYTCERFRFHKVNLDEYDKRYGVNDVRYFFFHRLVQSHAEWRSAFIVDAFDVRIGTNFCSGLKAGVLYVGGEQDKLRGHPWMKARFQKMGGKYNEWYKKVTDNRKILNCGITGGQRDVMLRLLGKMIAVLQDPAISIWKKKEDINLNMAALNYIVFNDFAGKFVHDAPVHSLYKKFETKRTDVWFIHK